MYACAGVCRCECIRGWVYVGVHVCVCACARVTGPAGSLDSAAHASRPATLTAYGTTLERVIHSAALALVDQAEHLNSLDAKVSHVNTV